MHRHLSLVICQMIKHAACRTRSSGAWGPTQVNAVPLTATEMAVHLFGVTHTHTLDSREHCLKRCKRKRDERRVVIDGITARE